MGDWLDDLMGITKELNAIKDEVTGATGALLGEEGAQRPRWNPSDYKEKPSVNVEVCPRCIAPEKASCQACLDVCPVDALRIEDGGIDVLDSCRKCGLCVPVCPTSALSIGRYSPKNLQSMIATAAQSCEEVYITCTRALGHLPSDGQIVLPCVGIISPEVWFSLLVTYDNLNVYLPWGICDRCRTTTGEQVYSAFIDKAEMYSERTVGLETEEADLKLGKLHEVERKEFLKNMAKKAGVGAASINPLTRKMTQAAQRLQLQQKRLSDITKMVERATGAAERSARRLLTSDRALLMLTLYDHPHLAHNLQLTVASVDETCRGEGRCAQVCPTHAIDMGDQGTPVVHLPHCVGCALCVDLCPQQALQLKQVSGDELVNAELTELMREHEELARTKVGRQEAQAAKEELKETAHTAKTIVSKAFDIAERFDDQSSDQSAASS